MKKSVNTVLIILTLIFVPFFIYAIMQIRSLEEEEQTAREVFERQMNVMLFSLNNLADDMMSQWIRRLSDDQNSFETNAADLTLGNESIQLLVLREMSKNENTLFWNDYVTTDSEAKELIKNWYQEKDSVLNRLSEYLDAGFQKIHAVEDWETIKGLDQDQTGLTAMMYDQDSSLYNALFIIEPNFWIEQILGAQLQSMDQDGFNLAVVTEHDEPLILYDTDDFDLEKDHVKKELWILSDTYLAIQPKGESYSTTIEKRGRNTLYFLLVSLFIFLFGAIIIVRNIRNALKIAQLKSDFVSNVSHEIRTPLSLIRMYSETLMLGRITDEKKKNHYYNIIHHESGRLTYLVNNILDFSRIEANQKTYQFAEHDLNELIRSLGGNFSFYFEEKKVAFNQDLTTVSLPISMDSLAMEEAFSNLIENAIKYGGENKRLSIKTYQRDNDAFVEISDKGIGISPEAQKHIFEKFYRVEDALTQKTKGTGLGLALVKHIVDAHNGTIEVSSKASEGSTFILKFPLTPPSHD